jgi:hypothetical protein
METEFDQPGLVPPEKLSHSIDVNPAGMAGAEITDRVGQSSPRHRDEVPEGDTPRQVFDFSPHKPFQPCLGWFVA